MLRLALIPLLFALALAAQGGGPAKDKEPVKKEGKKDKTPDPVKAADLKTSDPKTPLTIDQLKLSPEAVLVIVDEMKDVLSLFPKMVLIRPEKLVSMEERIKALEKLLKPDRRLPGVCKLSGRLDGDTVVLRGEFLFSTEQPRARVSLGLQGGFFTDEGELDGALPQLEVADDGYVVKVEKPGDHQLLVNLVVPVGLKRAGALGGSAERSVELGLPGAAVTLLSLELPPGVKELRWNDIPEKRKGGRWELALGRTKSLALTWKEPVALPGAGPFLTADAQITGKIEETQVIWNADVTLEDLRGQGKEWQLVFPIGARVDVKTAGSAAFDLQAIEGKPFTHLLKLGDPGTERWVVHAQVIQPLPPPGTRMPVGPFQVLEAHRQQGVIVLQASTAALRGQRLVFHRFGETYQRDLPKPSASLASFQYWSMPAGKGPHGLMHAPLELEWKVERGKAETLVEHELRFQPLPDVNVLELTSRFHVKVRQRGVEFLDIQLPVGFSLPGGVMSVDPNTPFPAGLEWLELFGEGGSRGNAKALDFMLEGEGEALEWIAPDSQGRARVRFLRDVDDPPVVVIKGRYQAARTTGRLHVDLPRPLATIERGTKVTVKGVESIELLRGKPGFEEPVGERQRFEESWEGPVPLLEFAWRYYEPEVRTSAIADVQVFERTARVVMTMPVPSRLKAGLPVGATPSLDKPDGLGEVRSEWKGDDLVLSYDATVQGGDGAAAPADAGRTLKLQFPWPKGLTHRDLKVRIWTEDGTLAQLDTHKPSSRSWNDRGVERVDAKGSLPNLVLFNPGPDPRLDLRLMSIETAAMLVDRALIQVRIEEDGSQEYRARFLVRKIFLRTLKLELPQAAAASLESVTLKDKRLSWGPDVKAGNVAHLKVEPTMDAEGVILEVKYKVTPAEDARSWRNVLTPPRWPGSVHIPRVRWQIDLARSGFVLPWGPDARPEFRWGLVGWLLGPVPAVSSGDLETWLTGQPESDAANGVALSVEQARMQPLVLLNLSRQAWLLLCSGFVLLLGLGLLLAPLPRFAVWSLASLLLVLLLALAWLWPALLAYVAYGSQPGLLIIVVLVAVQWVVQQNYHRQVVFLPGFTRLKAGSLLTKPSSVLTREPSTVDAPTPSGINKPSSVKG